jgi:predicted acetyltransferase
MEQQLNISLYKAGINDKGLLDNLLQLYLHDLSEFITIEVGPNGKYEQNISPQYVSSFEKSAYIIHAEYHIIGFVLTEPNGSDLKINDLFVLNMWRGKGVGSVVVDSLLRSGKALVCQFNSKNDLARYFWNNIGKNPKHKMSVEESGGAVKIKVDY